jgi:hypothetical protein
MVSVDDKTDLSTLTGDNEQYRKLVERKFQSIDGNVTWEDAKSMTKDGFMNLYGANEPAAVINRLNGWIKHHELEAGFKPPSPQQQNGKLICCSRILVFKCCFEYGNTNALVSPSESSSLKRSGA